MILRRLSIDLETYGPAKGSYRVEISVMENQNKIDMVLPPELGAAMVAQAKYLIHKFSVRAADQLHQELLLAAPELRERSKSHERVGLDVTTQMEQSVRERG